jgi:hypothetical protein
MLFKTLNPQEEIEFRQWARENYKPYSEIKGFWHYVVQDECVKINKKTDDCLTSFGD